jgi:hypothetical protein
VKRREFIAGLGSAAAWPVVGHAQAERVRRVGVLMAGDENDPEGKLWLSGFMQGLQELGWTENHNIGLDDRWCAGSVDQLRVFAKQLVELRFPIRSALGSLRACRTRAVISPASAISKGQWGKSGCNCSRRSFPA